MRKWMIFACAALSCAPAWAKREAPSPIHPIQPFLVSAEQLADKKFRWSRLPDRVYPRAAGGFVVFTEHDRDGFRVVRTSIHDPGARRVLRKIAAGETMREGVALADGAVGYVSDRFGPISAWMRMAHGDGHVAIANMGVWRGAVAPQHLNATPDGRRWCFDTTFEPTRFNKLLGEFARPSHWELLGQAWRIYDSRFDRHKAMYAAAAEGSGTNHYAPPAMFVFDRRTSMLVMFPNAAQCAFSPDGGTIAFVREHRGNYDIWMQKVDGGDLVQVAASRFAELEPAFSPDGQKLAFVSNRDSKGAVRETSIYVMDLTTGEIVRATNGRGVVDGGPSWLDDHRIIFHSNRDPKHPQTRAGSRWALWVVDLSK